MNISSDVSVDKLWAHIHRLESALAGSESFRQVEQIISTEQLAQCNHRISELEAFLNPLINLRPASEYHEDLGSVVWWHLPVSEPPYIGAGPGMGEHDIHGQHTICAQLLSEGWLTHFTQLPNISGERTDQ